MYNLIIVIPCYNEINLLNLINKIKKYNIIIVDDGSKIPVKNKIVKNKNIKIIRNKSNKGYEYSLVKGLKKAVKVSRYVLSMDADGEHLESNIKNFYNYAKNNNVDILIGARSRMNRFSEKILSLFFYFKYKIKDPLSGFKIYKSKELSSIFKENKHKEDFLVDVTKAFIKKKLNIKNYNIKSSKIPHRSSTMTSLRTNLKILSLVKYL